MKRIRSNVWVVIAAIAAAITPVTAMAAETAPAGKEETGLLDFNFLSAIWVLAIFLILVAILYKTAWKNVLAGLNAREQRIRADLADAESARTKGELALKEYNARLSTAEGQVRDILSRATVEAEKIAASIKLKAQQEVEESRERATREIDAARKQAMTEVYEATAELATTVAEKILKRNLNADDQRDLVEQSLNQLHTVG